MKKHLEKYADYLLIFIGVGLVFYGLLKLFLIIPDIIMWIHNHMPWSIAYKERKLHRAQLNKELKQIKNNDLKQDKSIDKLAKDNELIKNEISEIVNDVKKNKKNIEHNEHMLYN